MSWFSNLFNRLFRGFRNFIKIAINAILQVAIAQLKDFAIATVKELEISDLNNEQRRKEAFNRIEVEARRRAINIKDSAINLLIELALQYIKNRIKDE